MGNEIQTISDQNEIIELQKRQFQALVNGGFLPKGCSQSEGFARIVAGAQMGMKPIQALNGIAMINGHPTLHSDSIPCIVMASGLVAGMKYVFQGEEDNMSCTFYVKRKGIEEYQEWTYSMEDAKKAGLLNNTTWKAHPKKMLFNRARSWCLRNTFPDVIGNIYTKEEIEEESVIKEYPKEITITEDLSKYDALDLNTPTDDEKTTAEAEDDPVTTREETPAE